MDYQFTLEEYQAELNKPIEYADPKDPDDPLYSKKWAHCLPPLQAYTLLPASYDKVNHKKPRHNDRRVHHGWNNLSEFEIEQIQEIKDNLLKLKKRTLPACLDDRDVLKFG